MYLERVWLALQLNAEFPPEAATGLGEALTVRLLVVQLPYSVVMLPADWVTVQVADLPAWVAVTVQLREDVVVLLPAVSVVPLKEKPVPLALNAGVPFSDSVPPEPETPFHVQVRVRVAALVMVEVPPVRAIVVGLADTVTVQSLQEAYCLLPADWVTVQVADLPP